MQAIETIQTYYAGAFPNATAINSTGAATPDGTEYIAAQINNFMFGPAQAIMDYASVVPNGVTEAAGASQLIEAYGKAFGVGPGAGVIWWLNDDPSVSGHRVLLLEGQGVLIASYPELSAAVYVGDANNAAVAAGGGFFYKASDAAGTTPNTAGPYLILPDCRGYALRGLDTAAAVDPDGASRFLGDVQMSSLMTHNHTLEIDATAGAGAAGDGAGRLRAVTSNLQRDNTPTSPANLTDAVANYSGATETRMTNVSTRFGITY